MDPRLYAATLAALCAVRGSAASAQSGPPTAPTFSEHVAPILFRSCLPCHRAGESAPFALLEYEEVAKRARQIATVTRSGFMPPWLPSPASPAFTGDRRLAAAEIETIARWVEAGMPAGDAARLPPVPPAAQGWQLGEPDLVVSLPEAFVVPAEGLDLWRNFVIALPVERTRFVEAIELRPGNKRVAHHAVMRVDRTSASRELDARDPEPGFPGMDLALSESPDGQFLGWTPGKVPQRAPEGMAWTLEPGTDLVVQLHMVPTGKSEPLQLSVGLHFTEHPPARRMMVLRLRNDELDIAPGERAYVVEDSLTLPVGATLTKIYPHAHFLGKRIEVFGEPPGGGRTDLLTIEDWDFNWQDEYQYEEPLVLPAGTRLTMRYTFDNSAENPRNPTVPPRRVQFGNRSSDEMATLTLQVRTETGEERRALTEAVCRHRVEKYPGYWAARLNLGAILAERGKLDEAARELQAGLEIEPLSVDLHMNLGCVLASRDQPAEARKSFEEALRLSPGNPQVHANLALLEAAEGRWESAAEHYRVVLAASPRDARARRGLGTALFQLERLDEAAAALREALALDARDFEAHYLLGRIAFRQQRLEEATRELLACLELQPLPEAHAELARVYSARGLEDEARKHAEEARRAKGPKRR